jgi:galactose mutarotase-like enzyme
MSANNLITLRDGNATAILSPLGAELVSWRVGDVDMLWTPDPAFWDDTAPVLFPICGWTRNGEIRVDGRAYPLGLHGFARSQIFDVVKRGDDSARFMLRHGEATRAQYPFAFKLAIDYRLAGRRLIVEARVLNKGDVTMPYAFGAHPGFRWTLAGGRKEDYAIRFDKPIEPRVPVIAPGGLFSNRHRPVAFADPRTLPLSNDLFASEALCFLDTGCEGLDLMGPAGRELRVTTTGLPHIVLWSRPGAPFLCVESWSGYGDPDDFVGDLAEKPSMTLLEPGAAATHAVIYDRGPE